MPKFCDQLLELQGIVRRVLEPREEVEWLVKIVRVMQAPRDRREILHAGRDVRRLVLENATPLILSKLPPCLCFFDGNQRRPRRFRAVEASMAASGVRDLAEASLERLEAAWTEAKAAERRAKT